MLKSYGSASLSDFISDRIVFRSLDALDESLPRMQTMRKMLHLPDDFTPRKTSVEYAQVVQLLIEEMRSQDGCQGDLRSVLYLGDTRMNDGTAFHNICQVCGCAGAALITSEDDQLTTLPCTKMDGTYLFMNNHWLNLRVFKTLVELKDIYINDQTALLVDVDKTLFGARGRNDRVIDAVRVQAALNTLQSLVGEEDAVEIFSNSYHFLNQPSFHSFTCDNQDYLVYICLILASGLFSLKELICTSGKHGRLTFEEFITQVQERSTQLPEAVRRVHEEVFALVQAGDQTPFKRFRRAEYKATVEHMGYLSDATPLEQMLREEILITREVQEFITYCRSVGAVVLGLSDKPDEASIPFPGLSASMPLHRIPTHVVGENYDRK